MVLAGFWWKFGSSGGFLVDFLSVSGGFCGSSRLSVEFWVVWWVSGGFLVSVSGGFCGSSRFSVEFWVVWWVSGGFLVSVSGGFCGSGRFLVEIWVVWWISGGFLVPFLTPSFAIPNI